MQQPHYHSRNDQHRRISPRVPTGAPRTGPIRPRPDGSRRPSPTGSARPRPVRPYRPGDSYPPRYGAPRRPAQRRPQPSARRPAPHRARRRRPHISLFAFVALACLIALAAGVIHFYSVIGFGTPKYIENIYIDDISLAGLTQEEGLAKAAELQDDWLNHVYTLTYLDRSWSFSRSMVDASINYTSLAEQVWNFGHIGNAFERKRDIEMFAENPIHLESSPTFDEAKLDAFIGEVADSIDTPAVDAVVAADVDEPVIVSHSKTGLSVNREQLKSQLTDLVTGHGNDTAIPVETLFPAVTSDDMSYQVIAEFTTDVSFRRSASRSNVRIALNAFNGLAVLPGQRCSFNEIVGPRNEAGGFKKATEFSGDTTTMGWGGGVCQASTTLYNALLTSGMSIIQREPHSMTVSYVEPSHDAAVYWPNKDLVFQNDTEYPIYIYTSVTDEEASVKIYGHRPQYRYVLESVIIDENVPSTREVDQPDEKGKHAYYTDERVLKSKGKPGCISEGWLVAYDWDTGAEVSRRQMSRDSYRPSASVFYVGTHPRMPGPLMQYSNLPQ